MTQKAKRTTIDATPTWAFAASVYIRSIESGTAEGRKGAIEEIMRMAGMLDRLIAATKANPDTPISKIISI